jgi:hypothetical protein
MQEKKDLYISKGNFEIEETIVIQDGVSIYGGYSGVSTNWTRGINFITRLIVNQPVGMKVLNLQKETRVESIHLNVEHNPAHSGSSHGVQIINSPLFVLRGNTIVVGSGSDAVVDGSNGIGYFTSRLNFKSGLDGGNGDRGNPGCESSWGFCKSCSRPVGGEGGYSSCLSNGGQGGRPGRVTENGDNGNAGHVGPDNTPVGNGGDGTPPTRGNWVTPDLYSGFVGYSGDNGFHGTKCQYPCFQFTNEGFSPLRSPSGTRGKHGGGGGGKISFFLIKGGGGKLQFHSISQVEEVEIIIAIHLEDQVLEVEQVGAVEIQVKEVSEVDLLLESLL